ncbi:toprim domain-containing protein [Comamonas aquatica]|uniref:DNA primase (Bacterial type) n=1 Tax=Comamonas aquatica TaxID=225991 RepID=A0AA35D9L1_9BURK|nr:toprim domain-containing protein [Comamonas aquatica]CAB5705372.1 DNA primase (bacterial type) [Comamonas aquatica]CAC9678449.1 DNA primase (bacterial type) [Comamonas aquatica]
MTDLLHEIAQRLQTDYDFKPTQDGKHLRKGRCPNCGSKSLWTFAASPWVVRCERLNHCGYEAHAKDLYSDLFESWSDRARTAEERKPEGERNPHAAADAYLQQARGFDLALIRGLYTQEQYFDQRADRGRGAGTATVRFAVAETWWERLIDRPARFDKKKANFKYGGSYGGRWWCMPGVSFAAPNPAQPDAPQPPDELWLVEGIFDAIALTHHGIAAVALMSCNNYPAQALQAVRAQIQHEGQQVKPPRLVFALDGDKAGREYTLRHVRRAKADGWQCTAAQIPQPRHGSKLDWNDLHLRDRLGDKDLQEYRHQGALLVAETAMDKALLIYHHTGRTEFDLDHGHRLYWFKLDLAAYSKAKDDLEKGQEQGDPHLSERALRDKAIEQSAVLQPIANCLPRALYYQRNEVTLEAWYYFSITLPHENNPIKGTFTAGHLTSASEFKKQLLHLAPGAIYSGSSAQLERMMLRQLDNIKVVQTVDFVGYSAQHKTYLLGDYAVHDGQVLQANEEDYFEVGKLSIKSLQRSIVLQVNQDAEAQDKSWPQHLWAAFGAPGYVALAYWFASLFAEQIRAEQMSFPFLEIVGEPGSGKTTLIQFLWKLFGRDYEGFDPSKSTAAGRMRTFTQVSNLPIVLIESDRETKTGNSAHVRSFDWDELKDAYNGRSVRTTGVRTGGNETYEPPFRASIVISQNNQVQASQAIMERICHMTFTTHGHTPESFASAKKLETYEMEQLSGFLLACLRLEVEVQATFKAETDQVTTWLLEQDGIHKPRIAKNHAQLLVAVMAMSRLMRMSDAQFAAVRAQIVAMAQERQRAISADHPLVQEFWEAFDYLDSIPKPTAHGPINAPRLNHSRDHSLIAVNLNEFVEMASERRQQVPPLAELKKVLRTSKTRRFVLTQ